MLKVVLLLLSSVPLVCHVPYLRQAWNGSRLDQWDWIFYLLSIPAAVWVLRGKKMGKCDFYALFLLIPALFLSVTTPVHQVNAIGVAASVGVIFAAIWLLTSWQVAYRILPAAVILLLGTPSSSYQLSLLMMCPVWLAWAVKFFLAVVCFIWIGLNKRYDLQINKGTLFFSAAVLGSCLLLLHSRELYFEGKSFIPEYSTHAGDFWGRTIVPDENTKRFFATSTVRQFRYTKDNTDISVLSVRCGKNIHEIHPASHCLRTSMWTVHSENILYLSDNFAVTEINAQKGKNNILVWVWYSSDELSTPAFLGFRRHFKADGKYYTCQISIPVYENIEKSRSVLKKFVNSLKQEKLK